MDKDTELFKGTTFSDIMERIYKNSKSKDRQLKMLIGELEPLVNDKDSAATLVPLIKEYMEISVKNDDQLVKLAAIVQRMLKQEDSGSSDGIGLTEDEKAQLEKAAKDIDERIDDVRNQTDTIDSDGDE